VHYCATKTNFKSRTQLDEAVECASGGDPLLLSKILHLLFFPLVRILCALCLDSRKNYEHGLDTGRLEFQFFGWEPKPFRTLPLCFGVKNVTTLYHPPYSPDLSLPDYFLFPKLKMKLKGLRFADVAEIQEAVTDKLKKFQKEEFLAAFQKLYNRAKAYIYANGAYFELKKKRYVSSSFVFEF
jgi:hypothetical protein